MRRNLVRSLLAASVLLMSACSALLASTAAPAAAADNNLVTVYLTDNGFSNVDVHARVGDQLLFVLGDPHAKDHTVTWDDGSKIDDELNGRRQWVTYPMNHAGCAVFYDRPNYQSDPKAFVGLLTVDGDTPTKCTFAPPTTTTTTVTTASTTTTTRSAVVTPATIAPTTTTTEPASIHPLFVASPASTTSSTTTTTAPKKASASAAADKGKGKEPSTTTTTTPPAVAQPAFDSSMLTPMADPVAGGGDSGPVVGPAENIDAAAVTNLLPDRATTDDTKMLIGAIAGFGLIVLLALGWRWINRSSRYFPA